MTERRGVENVKSEIKGNKEVEHRECEILRERTIKKRQRTRER